jgi:AMMECR1 domain-containing protein
VARASIRHGLRHGQALAVNLNDYAESLRPWRATFVTLEIGGQLRGCIGALAPINRWCRMSPRMLRGGFRRSALSRAAGG